MFYSEKFRDRMLKKLLSPGGPSARELALETGVSSATLCRWRRDSLLDAMSTEGDDDPDSSKNSRPKQSLTSLDRARLVMDAEDLEGEERGAFLRRHGLHEADLRAWKAALEEALDPAVAKKRKAGDKKLVEALQKELRKKEKALAEAAALLVLRKKVRALLGEEDDDTDPS